MKFHKKKFLTTVSAVALVLAVGACSSNGDDDGITAERDTALEDLKAAQAEVGSLTEELATANSNLGIATGRVMDLETLIGEEMDPAAESLRGMLAQANMALDGANTALQMAMDNSVGEMEIARLTTAVTDAETMRDGYKGMVDAANLELDGDADTEGLRDAVTRLELALAKIEMETEAGRNAMDLADRIAREDKIQAAIGGASRIALVANEFPSDITAVTATRNPAGMVTVKVSEEDYTGGETTAGSGDWNGVTLTNGTNTLVIYTDIEAPSDVLFTTQYADVPNFLSVGQVGKAVSGHFPTAASATWDYTGVTDERPKSFRGSYDGAPGVFECTAVGTCMLSNNAKGELAATDQVWDFTPDAPNAAMVKDPDTAYAHFGWWLNKPEDNTDPHMTEVFAGGTDMHAADVNNAIEGTARYAGPAAGKYATKTFSAGVQADAGVGHFTAKANLTAKFGDDGAAGTIGGSVTGFVLDTGASPTWTVKLEDATISDATFDGITEATFGPNATAPGTWQGSFYDDADDTDNTNAPGTVAGTFDAVSANNTASVIGAFGATKQ